MFLKPRAGPARGLGSESPQLLILSSALTAVRVAAVEAAAAKHKAGRCRPARARPGRRPATIILMARAAGHGQ